MIDRVEQKKGVTLLTLFQDFLSIYPNNVIACKKTSFVRVPTILYKVYLPIIFPLYLIFVNFFESIFQSKGN